MRRLRLVVRFLLARVSTPATVFSVFIRRNSGESCPPSALSNTKTPAPRSALYDDIMATARPIDHIFGKRSPTTLRFSSALGKASANHGAGALDRSPRTPIHRGKRHQQLPLLHRVAHASAFGKGMTMPCSKNSRRHRHGQRNQQARHRLSGRNRRNASRRHYSASLRNKISPCP